jgi:hypothetical protein
MFMTRFRRGLGVSAISAILWLVFLEVILRALPVSTPLFTAPVNAASPVKHFFPNQPFTYSKSWYMEVLNKGRVNNDGFVNPNDYIEHSAPTIGVIGDSYVEALAIPYLKTFHGRLSYKLSNCANVYSFGTSGAQLSTYLIYAEHAVKRWGAAELIINIVSNDFDESSIHNKHAPSFHYFQLTAEGGSLVRIDYSPGVFSRAVRHSALLRYVVLNLEVMRIASNISSYFSGTKYEANVLNDTSAARMEEVRRIVTLFFELLSRKVPISSDKIIFVIDAVRPAIYEGIKNQRTYFGEAKKMFIARAREQNYKIIDMEERFSREYRHNRTKFELRPDDAHWSALAHRLVADEIMKSGYLSLAHRCL